MEDGRKYAEIELKMENGRGRCYSAGSQSRATQPNKSALLVSSQLLISTAPQGPHSGIQREIGKHVPHTRVMGA